METYFQCKCHGRRTIQVKDFGLVHAIVDHEVVDIRSKFVILRLAKRIKELKIDDESHIRRSNKWVMKENKKTKCCNNWKLIFVLFVVFFFLFLSIIKKEYLTCDSNIATDDPCIATYETYVATYDLSIATDASYVATYHLFVSTYHPYVTIFD
ncbi:hypothetical protein H5410_035008 [Solanum commersonii]|uniref:Transmembrane protein n=1 Tax=Solanum commersonii TaxID=4109 RepID=A0A9J5Y2L1_SOLCO|nr:hypothetical protein H5410_035008 [Solanum commersonii]